MLEPQSTLFFVLLMAAFGGLLVWLVLTKQVVFRVLAACLAFIPAMVFGIAAVNKYYDYYQTWGSLYADLSGSSTIPQISTASLGTGKSESVSSGIAGTDPALDAELGLLFKTTVTGPVSHIKRTVYVYLPPQYFSSAYKHYRFPAIELLHGSPGDPASWINVMSVIPIFRQLMSDGQAHPAVLVMPDTNGGLQYSLQCLNDPHGLQDMTFVGKEVPQWVANNLRVMPPSVMWGIAGYSEGGYCTANIALQYASKFGYAGVMSGYFSPLRSQVPVNGLAGGKPEDVNVFGHNRRLALKNTPTDYILNVPVATQVPQFYLAVGSEDRADVNTASTFRQLLLTRLANVPFLQINGGGHQARVWRAALGPMLAWMTTQLAYQVQQFEASQAYQQARAARERAYQARHHPKPHQTKSPAPHALNGLPSPHSTGKPPRA